MSRMRKTHVRFCESKEDGVAPHLLATRYYHLVDVHFVLMILFLCEEIKQLFGHAFSE